MYIYLIRHGETIWNHLGKVQGVTDIDLNETGIHQAKIASQLFQDRKLEALITSPLKRAVDTGKYLIEQTSCKEIKTDSRIIEKSFGICEGMSIDQRRTQYPNGHAENEESFKVVRKRMIEAFVDFSNQYNGDILVVSHGSAMAALLKELDPIYENEMIRFKNVSLTVIDLKSLKVLARDLTGEDAEEWMKLHPSKSS